MSIRRRICRALLKTAVSGLAVVLLLAGIWLGWVLARTHSGLPDYDAVVLTDGVAREVRVLRDNWGVPHIYAESEPDAYFALGYCMAQDRLFQMDVLRRLARGELAELLGPPVVIVDRIMRAFRLRAKAEDFADTMGARFSPEMNAAMHAFIDGVNQYIEENPLPWEFVALMTSCRPFTPADCIAVAAVLPLSFADGLRVDPIKSLLLENYPDHDVDLLFRGIEATPVTIMESFEEAAAFQRDRVLRGRMGPQAAHGLEAAIQWLDAMAAYARIAGTHLGSNSWVLSGEKTASGKPILANDPHIAFTNPSIWYEVHLNYADFENYGYHLPPIPVPLLGHNEDRGWGITMFANDDVDLYLEKPHPEDPNRVLYRGEWTACTVVQEHIKVRFGRDVRYEVRVTPHGAIINDLLGVLFDYDGPPVSLSWTWQHFDYTDVAAFYEMGHARDYERFAEAIKKITSPGLSISYADRQGNIAWWAAGLLPLRPAHVDHKTLLEGWSGRDEIEHYLPFEATPHLKNPPNGMIVTANNLPTIHPVGKPPLQIPFLQGYFKPGDRAGRIKELLLERDDWTIEDLRAVQMDDMGFASRTMAPIMTELVRAHENVLSPMENTALTHVERWDYRHDVDSIGAAVFNFWLQSLLSAILGDELSDAEFTIYATLYDSWIALQDLLQEQESHWWNDVTTPGRETPSEIAVRALQQACAELARRLGPEVRDWRWGRAHTVTYKHPFGYLPGLGRLLSIGPLETGGGNQVVNHMLYRSFHDFSVLAGPSTRRLIDFAAPDQSLTILPTGNSGHIRSPHYADQAELFVQGVYRTALFSQADIEAAKAHEMRFVPGHIPGAASCTAGH